VKPQRARVTVPSALGLSFGAGSGELLGVLCLPLPGAMRLPCLIESDGHQRIVRGLIVVHPLWRADRTLLSRLGVPAPNIRTVPIDTFDLERRPLCALEMVEERGPAPTFQAHGGK
jgi:hypothetical protein